MVNPIALGQVRAKLLKWRTRDPQFMGLTVCNMNIYDKNLEIRSRTLQSKLRSNQIKTVVICQLHRSYRIKFRILSKCWLFSLELVIAIWASTILQIQKCVNTNLYSYFDHLSQGPTPTETIKLFSLMETYVQWTMYIVHAKIVKNNLNKGVKMFFFLWKNLRF